MENVTVNFLLVLRKYLFRLIIKFPSVHKFTNETIRNYLINLLTGKTKDFSPLVWLFWLSIADVLIGFLFGYWLGSSHG